MEYLRTILIGSWNDLGAPLRAVSLLAVGAVIAIFLGQLVDWLLRLLRFNRMSEKMGLTAFLRKGNVRMAPSRLVGRLCLSVALVLFSVRSLRELEGELSSSLMAHLNELFIGFLSAILIAVVGAVITGFLAEFAQTIARNAGFAHGKLLSKAIKLLGNTLIAAIALEQMGLGRTILSTMFLILVAAVALALALAFGLGCKDIARDAFSRFLNHLKDRDREGRGTDLEG